MKLSIKSIAKIGIATIMASALSVTISPALAGIDLRLSHSAPPGSDRDVWIDEFAKRVKDQTDGRVTFRIYPSNQLGDWEETYNQLVQGSIDAGVQSLSTKYDKRLAISWFPYFITDYSSAAETYNVDGFLFNAIDKIVERQNLTVLAPYANGMGGMAVGTSVEKPADPDADHTALKIRVWPSGAATHRPVLERLGYSVTTMPFSELYTGVQTGVIDGMIGGTPEYAVRDWDGIVNTWVQLNDHFEVNWLVMNRNSLSRISEQDRAILRKVAKNIAAERFDSVTQSDEKYRQMLRDSGVTVVTFSEAELKNIAETVRKDVWPKIKDELGDELYQTVSEHYAN